MREILGVVAMQVLICVDCKMIAAPVQCDVDGIPKRTHSVRVRPVVNRGKLCPLLLVLSFSLLSAG